MSKTLPIFIFILLILPVIAKADLICKGKRIDGYSKFDVLRYCGEPLMKDSYLKHGKLYNYTKTNDLSLRASVKDISWLEVQQWFYTIGYQKTSYAVEFEGGIVVRIIKGKNAP